MPSVRVKRDQYSSLTDDGQEDPAARRPRSRTFAGSQQGSPNVDEQRAQYSQRLHKYHYRRRSRTVDGPRVPPKVVPEVAPGTPKSPVPRSPAVRPPSRVTNHIMSATRTPRLGERTRRMGESNDAMQDVLYSPAIQNQGQPSSGKGVVSLHGPREDVVYRGNDQAPGRIGSALSLAYSEASHYEDEDEFMHHDDIVEHLDVIDPQVATVSTLTDMTNSLVFPPLSFYSRKPIIVLPDIPERTDGDAEKGQAYEDNLDKHVDDVLRKRDKFRRIMKGVWAFMKTPLGIVFSIYGFMVVFWGTGIVVFLIPIIDFHNDNTQSFWVELCQQVETGLFTATSIGLIPFRVLDTWRIYRIWKYQRITIKRREKAGLPVLYDNNDLPDPYYDRNYIKVLTDQEQEDLHYQQHKFMRSMTWYRPHGTFTHRAFPIYLALWICIMNDLNSFFQILLSACMWSMDRYQRPAWTTALELPAAFVAGILAGVFIWWGSKKTRRLKEVSERLRAALAMEGDKSPETAATSTLREEPGVEGSIKQGTSSSLRIPEMTMKDKSPISSPGTTDTTPTIDVFASPLKKDYADDEEADVVGQKGKAVDRRWNDSGYDVGMQWDAMRRREPHMPKYAQRMSTASSVPIADTMTVPRADAIYPPSVPRR